MQIKSPKAAGALPHIFSLRDNVFSAEGA